MNREEALKILINGESEPCYKTCDEDCGHVMICLNHKCKWAEAMDVIREALKERPHGEWIRRHYINGTKSFDMYVCSTCGEEFSYDAETGMSMANYKFCPNCGAKMRKEGDGK